MCGLGEPISITFVMKLIYDEGSIESHLNLIKFSCKNVYIKYHFS